MMNDLKVVYSVKKLSLNLKSDIFQDDTSIHETFEFIEENFSISSLKIKIHDIDFDFMRIPKSVNSLSLSTENS